MKLRQRMSKGINITNGFVTGYQNKYQTKPEFILPHQCDEWEIGDIDDAKQFVKDLQKTISEVEAILKEQTNE